MSDNIQQTDTELFDSVESDNGAETDILTEEKSEDLLEGKESQTEELVLDKPGKKTEPSKAEIERQKQIDTWASRVMGGKLTLDELPKDSQWLKPYILDRMDAQVKIPEIEQLVEKKLAEKEEARKYDSLKAGVNQLRLTATQRTELQSEFKDLLEAGLSKAKALEKAMKMAGIPLDNESQERQILKQRMAVPAGGYDVRDESLSNLDDKDFFKKLPRDRATRRDALKSMLSGDLG